MDVDDALGLLNYFLIAEYLPAIVTAIIEYMTEFSAIYTLPPLKLAMNAPNRFVSFSI